MEYSVCVFCCKQDILLLRRYIDINGNDRFTTEPWKPSSLINHVADNVVFSGLKVFNSDNFSAEEKIHFQNYLISNSYLIRQSF